MNKINLSKGFVDISDPCYDKDTWCRINNIKVKPGIYRCHHNISDEGDWGMRVKESYIVHENFSELGFKFEKVGAIGVDAGLAGYLPSDVGTLSKTDEDWDEFCDQMLGKELIYKNCYITSSGYGDGSYTVYGAKEENTDNYIFLKIVFI